MTLKELLEVSKFQLQELTTVPNPDFRLEQAEYKKDEKFWEIVVSYLVNDNDKKMVPLERFPMNSLLADRIYKRVKITDDKTVLGFYIYND